MHTACSLTKLLLVLSIGSLILVHGHVVANDVPIHIIPVDERKLAPEFVSEKLEGGNTHLGDYTGQLLLLNFWATWCVPCRQEMPSMETLWQKYRSQGLAVIAIAIDEGSRQRVATFKRKLNLSFPILLDPNDDVGRVYEVSALPASYLIDRQGKMISHIVGSRDWSSPEMESTIEHLLLP